MNIEHETLAKNIHAHAAGSLAMVNSVFAAHGASSKIGRAVEHPLVLAPYTVVEPLQAVVDTGAIEPTAAARVMMDRGVVPHPTRRTTLPPETRAAIDDYLAERAELLERVLLAVPESQARLPRWHMKRTARLRAMLGASDGA